MLKFIFNIWLVRVGTRPVASIVNQTEEMNTFWAQKRTEDSTGRPLKGHLYVDHKTLILDFNTRKNKASRHELLLYFYIMMVIEISEKSNNLISNFHNWIL